MAERFYRFPIPRHPDGTIAVYPKEWSGVFSHCPRGMKSVFLNDKDGWGIGSFDQDDYKISIDRETKKPEMVIISKAEALDLMSKTQPHPMIFNGEAQIAERWAKREAEQTQKLAGLQKALFDAAIEKVLNG